MRKVPYSNGFAASSSETVEIPLITVQVGHGSAWLPGPVRRTTPVSAPIDDEATEASPPRLPRARARG